MNRALRAGVLFLLLVASGCNKSDLNDVSGAVTLDGQPLQEGQIFFRPEDPNHAAQTTKIADGRYTIKLPAGKHRVQMEAARVVPYPAGKTGPMGETGYFEHLIPDRYNAKSELSAEVVASGENRFDFHLESKKK